MRFILPAVVLLAASCLAFAHESADTLIGEINRRIQSEPQRADLLLQRADLHRSEGRYDAALRDCGRARSLEPSLSATDLCLGRIHLEAARPSHALESLDAFLRAQPGHSQALAWRAATLAALGRHAAAAESLSAAIASAAASGSPRIEWYLDRAEALVAAGQAPAALEGLDEGVRRLGPAATLVLAAIDVEMSLGRHEAALARARTAALSAPRPESWLIRQAEILEAGGRHCEARAAWAEALAGLRSLPAHRRATAAVARLEADLATRLGAAR